MATNDETTDSLREMNVEDSVLLTVATSIYSAQCIGHGNRPPDPQYAVEAARKLIEEVSK